ncbi:MAG: toxin-antitoxin system TumE family protein [Desulfotomaculales bacterium]
MSTGPILDTLEVLKTFDQIIVRIEQISSELRGRYLVFKAKVFLLNGTNLRIYRAWKDGKEVAYNYYWLDQNNRLIIGWDNSHEVKGISSSPHHKHVGEQSICMDSEEKTLANVLKVIMEKILKKY